MRLFMKQRVFSWRDRFSVWDESGADRYFAEGEIFTWGKRLHVCDPAGNEVIYIQQKMFTFLPRYHIYVGGRQIAEIVKEFTFFRPRYTVEGLGWEVEGDFFSHDYRVTSSGREIAEVHKEWLTWGDCYTIEIFDPRDERAALAVVLAIDCAVAQQSNN